VQSMYASGLKKPFLLTVVTQQDDFDTVIADTSVTRMPDAYEMTVLCLDEAKYRFLKRLPYDEEAYDAILEEAKEYMVYSVSTGNMSGRTSPDISRERAIKADQIIVQDGHFAGVLLMCKFQEESYMHSTRHESYPSILFADGVRFGKCETEWNFNPGGRWHLTKYYLDKAEKWEEIRRS